MSHSARLVLYPEALRSFTRLWITGLIAPARAFDELKSKSAPSWGFSAVTTRFVITSLTETVPLNALGRTPFAPSRLPFLSTRRYYAAQRFFLPVYGVAMWLAMGALGYGVLRRTGRKGRKGRQARFDEVLNIVGTGMLIPMPALWLWDWIMIATNRYRVLPMAISHASVELWEALLFAVGFHRTLGLRKAPAVGLGVTLGALYSAVSALLIR